MRKCFLIAMMLGISTLAISAQKTSKSLEPVQPTPTTKQVEWQRMGIRKLGCKNLQSQEIGLRAMGKNTCCCRYERSHHHCKAP